MDGETAPGPLRWLERLRRRQRERSGDDRILLLVAVVLFVVTFAVAVRALPQTEEDLDLEWWLLVAAAVVAAPVTAAVNAWEYAVTAAMADRTVQLRGAFEVAVLSSAANLLPIPGAALVRIRALTKLGTSGGRAVSITAIAGLTWLAVTLLVAGLMLLAWRPDDSSTGVAAVAAGAGAAGLAAAAVALARIDRARALSRLPQLVAVEVVAVAVGVLRYGLIIEALGVDGDLSQAAALTVSVVVASALGFLPGGLGIRELLGGAIAPLVGLPAAVGLLIVAVDRIVALPALAVMAAAFAARPGPPPDGP